VKQTELLKSEALTDHNDIRAESLENSKVASAFIFDNDPMVLPSNKIEGIISVKLDKRQSEARNDSENEFIAKKILKK